MYRIHSNVKTGRKRGFSYRKLRKELQARMPAFIPPRSEAEVHRNLPFQKPRESKSRITILSIKNNKVSSYLKRYPFNVKTGRKPEACILACSSRIYARGPDPVSRNPRQIIPFHLEPLQKKIDSLIFESNRDM